MAYVAGILLAFVDARIACAMYLLVALLWLVPDRRIEKVVGRIERITELFERTCVRCHRVGSPRL